ncbi:MAG: glycoside hydrolase family 3 N-terminal domain-containing protein [Rikenellaceae bacterium]
MNVGMTGCSIVRYLCLSALALIIGCSGGGGQVVVQPLSDSKLDNIVEEIYNSLSQQERAAQLSGVRPKLITVDGVISRELCREVIPHGIGHICQFACTQDLPAEKIRDFVADLQKYLIEETRPGIPAIFHEEAITGFSTKGATTYPQQIGVACSWNPDLVRLKSEYTRESMRSVGATFALSPMVDVVRSQHFNRGEESYGEDGYLAAVMASAFVEGLQGDDLRTGVAATTKHFLGYGGGVNLPMKEVVEEIVMPHESAIRISGSKSLMPGYHSFRDETAVTNSFFLQDVLRDYLEFDGIVVSDYFAISAKGRAKGNPRHLHERAAASINAGADLELCDPETFPLLPQLIEEGLVSQDRFEDAVKQNLRMKGRLGLLDREPKLYADGDIDLDKEEYRELAYDLATQSIVLLKNDGVLPLSSDVRSVALVGPNANSAWAMFGDYTYQAHHAFFQSKPVDISNPKVYTFKEGLERALGSKVRINYERGCDWNSEIESPKDLGGDVRLSASKLDLLVDILRAESDPTDSTRAIERASESDVVIAAVGECAALCGEGRDRKGIRLPGEQESFVEALIDSGRPVIVVIFGGRAQVLSRKILDGAMAIVQAWYPGQMGGLAVADIISGAVNPSGKLCTSYPATESRKPLCYNYGAAMEGLVEYPFGYGLSYTTYEYTDIKATNLAKLDGGNIEVSFTITNIGDYDGEEIVQLYISPADGCKADLKPIQLKGFDRVALKAGESKRVGFSIPTQLISYYDMDLKSDGVESEWNGSWRVVPDNYIIKIGSSSSDIHLEAPLKLIGDEIQSRRRSYLFSENITY